MNFVPIFTSNNDESVGVNSKEDLDYVRKKFVEYKNQNVIVTGGAGFIGSHLVKKLHDIGSNVLVIDDLSFGHQSNLYEQIRLEQICITNKNKIENIFKLWKPRYVFHLAAYSRTQGSDIEGHLVYNTNVNGTLNVVQCSVDQKINRLIYSGSSTYYGSIDPPHNVNDLSDFGTHYSISKYTGEEIVKLHSLQNKLNAVTLRYFSVYGEGQPSTGEYALVLGIFIDRFLKNLPLIVHGDGKQKEILCM